MAVIFEGDTKKSRGLRIGVVVSKFNEPVTGMLLKGALAALREGGLPEENIHVVKVPGAFEIPLAALRMARSGDYAGLVCLGAVIRGETPHFDHIAREVSRGIADVMMKTGVPVSLGVLTTDTAEQAVERADAGGLNRGADAARTALEMADLLKNFKPES